MNDTYAEIREFFKENEDIFNTLCDASGVLRPDDIWYPMDEFDDVFSCYSHLEVVEKVYSGDFNPYHNYFRWGVYLESSGYQDYSDYMSSYYFDDLADEVENLRNLSPAYEKLYNLYVTAGLLEIPLTDEELHKLYVEAGLTEIESTSDDNIAPEQ